MSKCSIALNDACQSAGNLGSDAVLMELSLFGADDAGFEQVELPPAVHLPFDECELGDLALSLTVRPGLGCGRADCCPVLPDAVGEGCDDAGAGAFDPGIENCQRSFPDHGLECGDDRRGHDGSPPARRRTTRSSVSLCLGVE